MDIDVWQHGPKAHGGRLRIGNRVIRCAIGKNGITSPGCEGDGATPAGTFPLRRILYRSDRGQRPSTALGAKPIGPRDGWCDESSDPAYNQPVRLPYPASAEKLARRDRLYDVIVILGHNDTPVIPGLGSAIFMHVARRDFGPTLGCVALSPDDLAYVLRRVTKDSTITIHETPFGKSA
ncbi:L,D-transpeptidase family protein [Pyruvatibacter sp.]